MRRVWIKAAYVAGIALGAFVAVAVLLVAFANTRAGQDSIANLVQSVTSGDVKVTELRGRFPQSLRASRVEIRDADGVWLILENVAVDWSPLRLFGSNIAVERLDVARAQILRLPEGDDAQGGGSPRVDIKSLNIARLETSASVSRRPMELSAQGGVRYVSLQDVRAQLALLQRDGTGSYRIDAIMENGIAKGVVSIEEKPNGLIAGLLGLNDIGPIALNARASGARDANRIEVTLDAGKLHAVGNGTIDLLSKRADVNFTARAPAMALRPDLAWDTLAIEGRARGGLSELAVEAEANVSNLKAAGNALTKLAAHVGGTGGALNFTATATGLQIAGLKPNHFARDPVELTGSADLKGPAPVVNLKVSHPLMVVDGRLELGERSKASATVNVTRLETLAALGGADIKGRGVLTTDVEFAGDAFHVRLNGKIDAESGDSFYTRLLGRNANIAIDANVEGADIRIAEARVQGAAVDARLTGGMRNSELALDLVLGLSDLSRVTPTLKGNANLRAKALGPLATAKLEVTGTGQVATEGFKQQELRLSIDAKGFPQPSAGTFRMTGNFNDAPVTLGGSLARNGRVLKVLVERGDWKSLRARADLTISENGPSGGQANLRMNDLRDLTPFTGQPVEGMLEATLNFAAKNGMPSSRIDANGANLRFADTGVGQLKVTGDIVGPADKIAMALTLRASGIAANGVSGDATAQANGAIGALNLRWDADLKDGKGNPAKVTGTATLNGETEQLNLTALNDTYREQKATLQAPATIIFRNGIAVQRLAARIGDGRLTLNGRLSPQLDATASLENIRAESLQLFVPLSAGTISANASLTGSLDAPAGTVSVQGQNLRFTRVPASIAPARLDARANLKSGGMSVDASLTAGPSVDLKVSGEAPLAAGQAFHLSAKGHTDLSVLNPILSAEGRNLRGQLALDAAIEGTPNKPRVAGTAQLSGGEVQDYPRGLRVHDIAANVRFAGDSVEIGQISGRAGDGTITGSGRVDLAAAGTPIALTFEARNAQPVSSDRFRANLDANVRVAGEFSRRLTASGTITIRRGETIIPESLPPRVVALNVSRPGAKVSKQEAPQSSPGLGLDLTIRSPGQFFVRGRGLEAELEGDLHIGGTDANPIIAGGLTMRRGTLDLAGQMLRFTSGRVTFDGAGLRDKIDPTLDFTAETTSGAVTARLNVTGYASAPRIQLSSTPQVPQDEVLARLLFQQSAKELSPFQLAQIAQAAAALGGVGSGFNPIASVRRSLGLDRLSVSSASNPGASGSQATIEAGKYVAGGVYVGAKQGLGNTTVAEVQIDLTKNLKAKATVGTGTNTASAQGTAGQDLGSSVGLSYQFEY